MTTKDFLNCKDEMIRFSIEYVGEKDCPNEEASAYKHNKVTIYNKSTKRKATIDFWGSQMEPNQDSESGLKSALDGIILDIDAYNNARSFEDFCLEFGYDTDSRNAERIFNGCGKEMEKFARVTGDLDIIDIIRYWTQK